MADQRLLNPNGDARPSKRAGDHSGGRCGSSTTIPIPPSPTPTQDALSFRSACFRAAQRNLAPSAFPHGQSNVFLQRLKTRAMLNGAELVRSFQEVFPAALITFPDSGQPLADTVAAFAKASRVFGGHGAGLAKVLLCRAGTHVFEVYRPGQAGRVYGALTKLVGAHCHGFADRSIRPPRCDLILLAGFFSFTPSFILLAGFFSFTPSIILLAGFFSFTPSIILLAGFRIALSPVAAHRERALGPPQWAWLATRPVHGRGVRRWGGGCGSRGSGRGRRATRVRLADAHPTPRGAPQAVACARAARALQPGLGGDGGRPISASEGVLTGKIQSRFD
jgi:hypothetical protein